MMKFAGVQGLLVLPAAAARNKWLQRAFTACGLPVVLLDVVAVRSL